MINEEGLRDWFGKSKSKDGKPGWVQSDGSPCANEPGEKGTPKCYSSAKKASMSKKELRSADTRKSRQDPGQQQKSGAAKPTYVSTDKPKKKMKESYSNWKTELDEGVLGGLGIAAGAYGLYKAGKYLKRKGDEALDNARQNATINGKPFGAGARQRAIENAAGAKSGTLDPKMQRLRNSYEPEGEIVEEGKDRKGKGSGTKDACYHKVKSRYSVWPSAYASGALVKCRKVGAKNWGNKTKNESYEFSNWRDDFHATEVESIDLISNEPLQQSQGLGSDMLDEANSKQDKLKEISKQLAGASKMHAKQSKKVAKVAANLDEKCWKGYKKKGMKTMFGKRYPNCVKAHFSDWKSDMDLQEKKKKNCGCGKDPCKTYGKQEVKEDWQKSNRKDGVDGMSQKSVNAYKRENPGSKLQTAVTGKVKKGSKDANRRKNYCSRSKGQMKMHNIDCSKTPDKKICKARKRWRC
jgi:hypothetical protein